MAMTGPKGDELRSALADARERFIASFSAESDTALGLVTRVPPGDDGQPRPLEHLAHKLAGRAGMAGFPTVAALCLELEVLAAESAADPAAVHRARDLIDRIRAAFIKDLAADVQPPSGVASSGRDRAPVLVVEDDDEQRAIVAGYLADAGYDPVLLNGGNDAIATACTTKPAAIILDVRLPDTDGLHVCQRLKADPSLARVPVLLVTARGRVDERIAGLALGADDYLVKPIDMRELAIRVHRACARAWGPGRDADAGVLSYAEFFERSRAWLRQGIAALAFIRTPPPHLGAVQAIIRREVRTRDLVGTYDAGNTVLLLPEATSSVASDRLSAIIGRLREMGIGPVTAGIAASTTPGASVMTLMRDAHEALIEARYLGAPTAVSGVPREVAPPGETAGVAVLLVDDDPDVARIVDAQMRAAGHKCTLAFDGEQGLAAMDRCRPDVIMLDLMMPRLGGFEVLARLNEREGPRPAVLVLSARGREADVTRAFELGASDYVTKPFSPQELMARVTRLAR